jgi:hypothetical protein
MLVVEWMFTHDSFVDGFGVEGVDNPASSFKSSASIGLSYEKL